MNWIIYLLSAAAGAANPAQAAANAELRKTLNQILAATMFVYLSGLIGILLIQLISRQPFPPLQKLASVPWWAWTGGLLSIAATMAGADFAQRLGSGVFTGISVTAALIMSLVLDNYGWMGFKLHPASWPRLLGCALMIAGLWMVSEF
ncbi:MAG: DMT family transporter [Bryobacteraceae bacterium]